MSLLEEKVAKRTEPALVGRTTRAEAKDALAGVKIVEFGAYAAGPCISKYLANFGARVVLPTSAGSVRFATFSSNRLIS